MIAAEKTNTNSDTGYPKVGNSGKTWVFASDVLPPRIARFVQGQREPTVRESLPNVHRFLNHLPLNLIYSKVFGHQRKHIVDLGDHRGIMPGLNKSVPFQNAR